MYFKAMFKRIEDKDLQLLFVCESDSLNNVVQYIGMHDFECTELLIAEISDEEFKKSLVEMKSKIKNFRLTS